MYTKDNSPDRSGMKFSVSSKNSTIEQTIAICWQLDWVFVVHSPSFPYIVNNIAACIVNAISIIAGIVLNSLVIVIFWKSAKMRKKIAYFIIMVLSSNDLTVITVVQPMFLFQSVTEILQTPKCLYKASYRVAAVTLAGMSAATLSVMNIERFLSIKHPVFHHVTITRAKCILMLISSWSVVVAIASILFIWPLLAHILIAAVVAFICFISLHTYLSIFYVVRKSLLNVGQVNGPNNWETSTNRMSFLRELKRAKTSILIVFLCFACYLPTVVVFGMTSLRSGNETTFGILAQAYIWSDTFGCLNSTLNCMVFFWSNRELKKQGWKIMKQCLRG